jgi:hypothetical protein
VVVIADGSPLQVVTHYGAFLETGDHTIVAGDPLSDQLALALDVR